MSVAVALGSAVAVDVVEGLAEGTELQVGVVVGVRVRVGGGVQDGLGVTVLDTVRLGVRVNVGEREGDCVADSVAVAVSTSVGVAELVAVSGGLELHVAVAVAAGVGESEGVAVGSNVAVPVLVAVAGSWVALALGVRVVVGKTVCDCVGEADSEGDGLTDTVRDAVGEGVALLGVPAMLVIENDGEGVTVGTGDSVCVGMRVSDGVADVVKVAVPLGEDVAVESGVELEVGVGEGVGVGGIVAISCCAQATKSAADTLPSTFTSAVRHCVELNSIPTKLWTS